MTLFQLLEEGTGELKRSGNSDAAIDAKELLMSAFHLDLVRFLMDRMGEIPDDLEHRSCTEHYREMIGRRRDRQPLQQILHGQEFMGLNFYVDRHVLIPRQDTESLVELVLAEQTDPAKSLLDLCTGSGCIAVSLAVKGGYERVVAADLSEKALAVAKINNDALCGGRVCLLTGDLFQALEVLSEAERTFDILTANPPYIPTGELAGLEPEVRDHEPRMALDGTEDGLHYYRRIAAEAKQYLKAGAFLYLEIGYDQGQSVSGLLAGEGYRDIRVVKDIPGNDRVVCARRG